jgi:hypothetical protein
MYSKNGMRYYVVRNDGGYYVCSQYNLYIWYPNLAEDDIIASYKNGVMD